MARIYSFQTDWLFNAPVNKVWEAIYLSEDWPKWWKGVLSVEEIVKGDELGIGSIRLYKMRSPMFYTLSFNMELTDRIEYQLLKGNASGELEGTGSWHFREEEGMTHVHYEWKVSTNKAWMNYLSFILKPLFEYNHDTVMKWGAESLARKLNTEFFTQQRINQ